MGVRLLPLDPKELLTLMRAALGELAPTLKIVNGFVIDVFSGNIIKTDVIIYKDRIVALGDAKDYPTSQNTKVIDVNGAYIAPGFMDAHIHIESTLLVPAQLAKILIPHGVTSLFADPHEIANVLGVKGIKLLLEMTKDVPLRIFIEVPSRVPTAPGLETSGAVLGVKEVDEIFKLPEAISLGELNYQNLLSGKMEYFEKIAIALQHNKIVNGHLAMLAGKELNASLAAGLMDDHECISADEAIDKVMKGCGILVREGTSERNLKDIISGTLGKLKDYRKFMFCTDDKHPEDIINEGHIDYNIKKAIELGLDPVIAIQMATINIASHFRVDHLIGAVAPHRKADLVVIRDLEKLTIDTVIFDGKVVFHKGELLYKPVKVEIPELARNTININPNLSSNDLIIKVEKPAKKALVRVIDIVPGQIITKEAREWLPIKNDYIVADIEKDILHIAVVDRHKATKSIGKSFVRGFGLKAGAIASSVAHDHHNIVVVGTNADDMLMAVKHLKTIRGGFVAIKDGKVVGDLPLQFAGLMSIEPAENVINGLERLNQLVREKLGAKLDAPFMQLEFITLPTVPELGLTNKGLIDATEYKIIEPLIELKD